MSWAVCVNSAAKAGVIIYFSEVAGNVVGRTSGSFVVPVDGVPNGGNDFAHGDEFQLFYFAGQLHEWEGGTCNASGLLAAPATAYGDGFGYSVGSLFLPRAATGTFFPDTTFEWFETTIEDIGLGYLTPLPVIIYELNGETISFARATAAIPEPASGAALIGGLVLGWGIWRRRAVR
ncbi:MAG: PEP-CTERM sorting domain-containing protein [Rariglobus sp.]